MGAHRCLVTVAAAVLLMVSCNPFARKRAPRTPPLVTAPPPAVEPAPEPVERPVICEPPPEVPAGPATDIPSPPSVATPAPVKPPPRRHGAPATTESRPPDEEQPVGPVAVPQLTQLLTAEQVAQYNREIDGNLAEVRKHLSAVSQRRLNEQQAVALDRVRALARQAAEARRADLETARGLAGRALLLARDLESTTR